MSRGGSTRPVSAIQVTADGSLHTDVTTHPPTFQVGNAFLYCTLTHTGVRQVLFTHGISAGEWSIRLCLGDVTLPFTRVHAAGHLLHALSHHPGCTARLISTLSPETPTIIHALDLHVPSPVDLELLVTLSPPPPSSQRPGPSAPAISWRQPPPHRLVATRWCQTRTAHPRRQPPSNTGRHRHRNQPPPGLLGRLPPAHLSNCRAGRVSHPPLFAHSHRSSALVLGMHAGHTHRSPLHPRTCRCDHHRRPGAPHLVTLPHPAARSTPYFPVPCLPRGRARQLQAFPRRFLRLPRGHRLCLPTPHLLP